MIGFHALLILSYLLQPFLQMHADQLPPPPDVGNVPGPPRANLKLPNAVCRARLREARSAS